MAIPVVEVLDLPQIHRKPSFGSLLQALQALKVSPSTWNVQTSYSQFEASVKVPVSRYLMSIISSPLGWLDEEQQEVVWDEASKRVAERSGVTGS